MSVRWIPVRSGTDERAATDAISRSGAPPAGRRAGWIGETGKEGEIVGAPDLDEFASDAAFSLSEAAFALVDCAFFPPSPDCHRHVLAAAVVVVPAAWTGHTR